MVRKYNTIRVNIIFPQVLDSSADKSLGCMSHDDAQVHVHHDDNIDDASGLMTKLFDEVNNNIPR